jgi:hypothetical protein
MFSASSTPLSGPLIPSSPAGALPHSPKREARFHLNPKRHRKSTPLSCYAQHELVDKVNYTVHTGNQSIAWNISGFAARHAELQTFKGG